MQTLHRSHPGGDRLAGYGSPTALAGCVLGLILSAPAGAQQNDEAATPEPVLTLAPIKVEGDPGVVTEDTGSYSTEWATVGYKQPVDIRRVPQTVNVLTRQRLDDSGATSIEEAAFLLPNLSTATGNGFSGSLYSRGHEVFTYNVDGAPRPFLSLYGTAPDLVFFDRLEVLSGPSGLFQGSGEPVGTLNLVRKRPTDVFATHVSGYFGSYDFKRLEADIGGPLVADGSVRGRLVGFGMDQESFIDFTQRERAGVYGTLEFDMGEATTLSIGGLPESQDVTAHSGLPTFTDGTLLDVAPETFIGAPWNRNDVDTAEGFIELEHDFASGAILKATGRVYDRETIIRNALASTGVDPATGDFDMFVFARDWDETVRYYDVNVTSPVELFAPGSEFTVGANYRDTEQTMLQNFDFSPGTQNINTFDPSTLAEPTITFPGAGPGFRLNTLTETEEIGFYGYTLMALTERLHLTLGGRYADYRSTVADTGRGTTTSRIEESRFVPLAGVSYDISDAVTGYVSYSEIFQAQSELATGGSQLAPLTGKQVELGVKVSMLDGRLNGQAAVYRLDDENRAVEDPDNPGFFLARGDATTKGFEASLTGSPMPGLDLALGYAYVDTELQTDPTSAHNLTATARYTFQSGALRDGYLGASVRAASDFESTVGDVVIEAPGYAVVNMMAGYHINDSLEAKLVVNNLFDKEYVERVNNTTRGTFYGEPLNALFQLTGRF